MDAGPFLVKTQVVGHIVTAVHHGAAHAGVRLFYSCGSTIFSGMWGTFEAVLKGSQNWTNGQTN